MNSGNLNILRWIARISAMVTATTILIFFIGSIFQDGLQPLLSMTVRETLMMLAFFFVWLGLILGLKWELMGGLITVAGVIAFYLFDFSFSLTLPRGPYFLIFASPSLLFILIGLLKRKKSLTENSNY